MRVDFDGGEFIPGERIGAERYVFIDTKLQQFAEISFKSATVGLIISKGEYVTIVPWHRVQLIIGTPKEVKDAAFL